MKEFNKLLMCVAIEDQRPAVCVEHDFKNAVFRASQLGVWKFVFIVYKAHGRPHRS